jgi:large-conductance mechanosensitive channel
MGNEDPWFVVVLGMIAFLVIAIATFIPVKFVQMAVRDWRSASKRQDS